MMVSCVAASSIFFLNFPGTPIHSECGSTTVPSGMTVPAAMIEPSPTFALLRMTLPIPIRQRSPMVQPCSVTEWPTVTYSPRGAQGRAVQRDPGAHGGVLARGASVLVAQAVQHRAILHVRVRADGDGEHV